MLISLGKIVKPQGLKGEFRVLPYSGESTNLDQLSSIVIAAPDGRRLETAVRSRRRSGALYILAVRDVVSIEQAQALVGGEIFAAEEDLEPPADGEFYWYEVIGMEVVTDEGENLGKVEGIIPTGANDVLQVVSGACEILLPNIPDVILNIDRQAGRITVHLLPGLR